MPQQPQAPVGSAKAGLSRAKVLPSFAERATHTRRLASRSELVGYALEHKLIDGT